MTEKYNTKDIKHIDEKSQEYIAKCNRMTSEIIIDGVKVSECKYFNKVVNEEPYCNIDEEHLYTCSSDENCYFKQLKRLEQKNFELEESLKVFNKPDVKKVLTLYNCGEITRLEQENKELKEENIKVKKEFNNLIAAIISDVEFTGEIASNGETPIEHLHKCQKALASLEEIRELAEKSIKISYNLEVNSMLYDITDKINEVLE